jgi:hypothetical protein
MLYIHVKGGLQRIPLSDRYFGVWVPEKRAAWLNVKIGNSYLNPKDQKAFNLTLYTHSLWEGLRTTATSYHHYVQWGCPLV